MGKFVSNPKGRLIPIPTDRPLEVAPKRKRATIKGLDDEDPVQENIRPKVTKAIDRKSNSKQGKKEPIQRALSAKEKDLEMQELMQKTKGEVSQVRKQSQKGEKVKSRKPGRSKLLKGSLSSDESTWERTGKKKSKASDKRESMQEDDIARYQKKPLLSKIENNDDSDSSISLKDKKASKISAKKIKSPHKRTINSLDRIQPIELSEDSEDDLIAPIPKSDHTSGSTVETYQQATRRQVKNTDYFESDDTDEICGKKAGELTFGIPLKRSNFAGDEQNKTYVDLITEMPSNHQEKCPVDNFCRFPIMIPFSKKLESIYIRYQELLEKHQNDECSLSSVLLCRDKFCSYHRAEETIIPQGIEKGYIFEIDFGVLDKKLEKCLPRLKRIIKGEIYSEFQQTIKKNFEELGKLKSQGTLKLISNGE
jgi:site-specific DNA-cytosine methylase